MWVPGTESWFSGLQTKGFPAKTSPLLLVYLLLLVVVVCVCEYAHASLYTLMCMNTHRPSDSYFKIVSADTRSVVLNLLNIVAL